MRQINVLLTRGIDFYENVLYRKYPKTSNRKFLNSKDIIEFLSKEKSRPIQQVHCSVAKVCLAVNSVLSNYSQEATADIAMNFIRGSFMPKVIMLEENGFPEEQNR